MREPTIEVHLVAFKTTSCSVVKIELFVVDVSVCFLNLGLVREVKSIDMTAVNLAQNGVIIYISDGFAKRDHCTCNCVEVYLVNAAAYRCDHRIHEVFHS